MDERIYNGIHEWMDVGTNIYIYIYICIYIYIYIWMDMLTNAYMDEWVYG